MSTSSTTTRARARVRVASEAEAPPMIRDTERKFYQATMAPEKFAEFRTHPRQRDTERHAVKAQRRHLKDFNITQANVSAAVFDGQYYKLDGHTRSMLWASGELARPDKVTVTIYNCETYDELTQLYSTFDNKFAAENGTDQLSGALREAGVEVTSQMFRSYKFLSALKRAWAASPVKGGSYGGAATPDLLLRQVKYFQNEIVLLDSINPSLRLFRLGVAGGAFLALKRRGESILPFFQALNENRGVQGDGQCDAVQALHNLIIATSLSTHRDAYSMMSRTVSCAEAWWDGRTYSITRMGSAAVKQTNLAEYTKAFATDQGSEDAKRQYRARAEVGGVVLPVTL